MFWRIFTSEGHDIESTLSTPRWKPRPRCLSSALAQDEAQLRVAPRRRSLRILFISEVAISPNSRHRGVLTKKGAGNAPFYVHFREQLTNKGAKPFTVSTAIYSTRQHRSRNAAFLQCISGVSQALRTYFLRIHIFHGYIQFADAESSANTAFIDISKTSS